jgi:hypothetical protein
VANEKLQIDITAKDDASKVIDPLQKKVAKLEQGKTTVKVEADAKKAIDDVDSFAQKLAKLGADDQVVLLSLKAAAAQSELTKLGTELADIDSSDPTIDVKLERYEQVSGDLDQLQAKIKQIADTPVASGGLGRELGGVKTKLEGMRGEADQSRSVLANLVGNSAQDLGQLGGVAGTTGVAIGQLAEYAADGNISLGNLAKFAGPMALVGVALFSVTTIMGEFKKEAAEAAKIKAFNVANAKEFADAAAEGVDIVDRYVESSKKAGKVEVAPGTKDFAAAVKALGDAIPDDQLLVLNDHIHDIGGTLVAAGQSAESFYAAAADTGKLAAFEDAVKRSNLSVTEQTDLIAAVVYQQGRYAAGQDLAKRNTALFATAQEDANRNADEGASLLGGLSTATDDASRAAQDAAVTANALAAAEERVQKAADATTASFDALKGSVADDQAFVDLQGAFDQVRTSSQEAWDATAAGADDAAAKVRANKSDVNSLKQQIIDYAQNIAKLPASQTTTLLAEVDDGQLALVEARIARIKANATINVQIQAKGGAGFGPVTGARASGGPVRAGEPYLVGDGPGGTPTPWSEIFIPNSDGTILNAPQTKRALQSRATGGSTGRVQNITHISQAAPVAAAPAGPVVDPSAAEDRRQAALYKTGQISLDVYQAYVKQRAAEEKATDGASDAYVAQYDLLQQLADQQKAVADQQQKAIDDQQAATDALMKNMYDLDAISQEEYTNYLKSRLGAFAEFSDGYTRLKDQINDLNKQAADEQRSDLEKQLANEKWYYTQSQAIRAAAEAEAAANEQLAAVFAAGDEGGRIQKDRNASKEDKAAAVQKLVDEQEKLADTAYRAAVAKASAEGLDTGSIPWDRYVRSVLDAAIGEYQAAGLGITVGKLQGYEAGIPALAKGGIVPATPGGKVVRLAEAGRDEAVIPLDGRGLGGDTHNYNITVNTLTGKLLPRDVNYIADELERARRRNGRAA